MLCIWTLTVWYSLRNVIHYSLPRQVAVVELYHNGISYVKNPGQNKASSFFFQESPTRLFIKLNVMAEMLGFLNLLKIDSGVKNIFSVAFCFCSIAIR